MSGSSSDPQTSRREALAGVLDLTDHVIRNRSTPIARGGFAWVFRAKLYHPDPNQPREASHVTLLPDSCISCKLFLICEVGRRKRASFHAVGLWTPFPQGTSKHNRQCTPSTQITPKLLRQEARIWASLPKHENFVLLLGYAWRNNPAFVSSWYQNGNLEEYLSKVAPQSNRVLLVYHAYLFRYADSHCVRSVQMLQPDCSIFILIAPKSYTGTLNQFVSSSMVYNNSRHSVDSRRRTFWCRMEVVLVFAISACRSWSMEMLLV